MWRIYEEQRIGTVYEMMSEENLRLQVRQPWIKVATDAGGYDPAWRAPHGPTRPRSYGTYPPVLGKYVREEGVLTLEEAVRKMSSAVADRLGLRDRGQVRPGMYADVVIFDPATVADRATITDPSRESVGIQWVLVGGQAVKTPDGLQRDVRPGRPLRRGGA